jgi:hypothetical protein
MTDNDTTTEGERWVHVPSRARHDEPISAENYARREAQREKTARHMAETMERWKG